MLQCEWMPGRLTNGHFSGHLCFFQIYSQNQKANLLGIAQDQIPSGHRRLEPKIIILNPVTCQLCEVPNRDIVFEN